MEERKLLSIDTHGFDLPDATEVFNGFFQTEQVKKLMPNVIFSLRISTDGYGCNVLFVTQPNKLSQLTNPIIDQY
jgi:hypothetical protein